MSIETKYYTYEKKKIIITRTLIVQVRHMNTNFQGVYTDWTEGVMKYNLRKK